MAIFLNSVATSLLLAGETKLVETYFGGRRKGERGRGAFDKVLVFKILGKVIKV
jgi:transposase